VSGPAACSSFPAELQTSSLSIEIYSQKDSKGISSAASASEGSVEMVLINIHIHSFIHSFIHQTPITDLFQHREKSAVVETTCKAVANACNGIQLVPGCQHELCDEDFLQLYQSFLHRRQWIDHTSLLPPQYVKLPMCTVNDKLEKLHLQRLTN